MTTNRRLLVGALLLLVGCGASDEGSRPGMPPPHETPDEYAARIRASTMPEEDKRAVLERAENNRRMIEQMKAANAPRPGTP